MYCGAHETRRGTRKTLVYYYFSGRGGGVRLTGGDWDPLVGSPGLDLSGGTAHYSACYCPWGTLDVTTLKNQLFLGA